MRWSIEYPQALLDWQYLVSQSFVKEPEVLLKFCLREVNLAVTKAVLTSRGVEPSLPVPDYLPRSPENLHAISRRVCDDLLW